jgi:hypothetical protein
LLIAVFGGFIYSLNKERSEREAEAQKQLEPYNNKIERYLKRNSFSKNRIPAKGNVIFVDEKTKKLDKLTDYSISFSNQPKAPDEVDSVVLYSCDYIQVSSYTNGSKAMQYICAFTVIDIATGTWSNWGEFKGTMPAGEIKRKAGNTSDAIGGQAIYSFFNAGGLVTRGTALQ